MAGWASIQIHDCLRKFGCGGVTNDFGILRCIGSFVLGIFVSMAPKPSERLINTLHAVAVLLIVALFAIATVSASAMFAAPIIFAFLIYVLSTDQGVLSTLFSRKIFQVLGERSYSIYLLHPVILMLFGAAMRQAPSPVLSSVLILAYVPTVTIAAGWTFRRIEDPMRKYFNFLALVSGPHVLIGSVPAR
jgi:peptidoglycan/LPS O-acetylase OafA/YrhL